MLVDSHCHLALAQFESELDEIVERAIAAGVTRIVTISTDLDDSAKNIELASRFPGVVYPTVGIHPCDVYSLSQTPDWAPRLRELASHPSVVAIGEIGTDHFHPPKDNLSTAEYHALQDDVFRTQMDIAVDLGKNIVIHTRDSLAHTAGLLSPYEGKLRAVLHCFTSPWELAEPLIAQNHLISFTGVATFKNAADVQSCARDATPGSFMVETDAPFLAPVPFRGKRNEPAYTRHTAEHIANLRGISLADLALATTATAEEFFSLPSIHLPPTNP